ncbi:MAG: fibronectin type III domain-containing protein [Chloroflexota bacterium]
MLKRTYSLTRAALHGLTILGIVFAAAASASPAYAAVPNNDLIANAVKINTAVYNGTVVDVAGATTSAADPIISCGASKHQDSVWYTFTPISSGEVRINTLNSQYDTVLAIFKGTPGALIEMGCNDNASGTTSAITMPLRGGIRYYIEVVRKNGTAITATADMRISYSYTNKVVLWSDTLGKKWDGSKTNLFTYSSGWQNYPVLGALLGNIQISNNVNNNMIAYFDGGSLDLTYATGLDMGNLDIYVDNVFQGTVGQNAAFSYPNTTPVLGPFSDNVHKLELRHSAGPSKVNFDFITVYAFPDVIPPAKITTLTATTGTSTGKVTLKWKAVGDDDMVGTATKYEVYYLPNPGFLPSCAQVMTTGSPYVIGVPNPAIAGAEQQMTLSGLVPGLKYYFCIRAVDEVGNAGTISNRATAIATAGTPWPTGIYDDIHQAWAYVGNWELINNPDARNNTVHVSKKIGDTASIYFTGDQFVYTYLTGPVNGLVDVYIDGVYTTTINQYSFFPDNNVYYTSPILADGPHYVQFVHMTQVQMTVDQIYVWTTTPPDFGPPDPIVDLLAVPGVNDGEVDLSWTSPGDDPGSVGTPEKYEIRYSSDPINNLEDWDLAQPVGAGLLPAPVAGGVVQNVTVNGLTPGAHYYFAVRSFDDAFYDVLSNTTDSDVTYTLGYAAAGTKYEDNDPIWFYSSLLPGWAVISDPAASGGAYHRITNAPAGSLARFWFNGTRFRVYFQKNVGYGRLDVYVDGVKIGQIVQTSTVATFSSQLFSGLAAGNHVVEFRVVGKKASIDAIHIMP